MKESPPGKAIGYILAPIPTFLITPLLGRIVRHLAARHGGLFKRIGPHQKKIFMIDPVNLPFALLLRPDPNNLELICRRRRHISDYHARISGSFLKLLQMIDGSRDGDALFFSRDLTVEGDTEAVVALRNALDDIDGNLIEEIAGIAGEPGRIGLSALRRIGGSR